MKGKKYLKLLLLFCIFPITGCNNGQNQTAEEKQFNEKAMVALKEKANEYSEGELQNGDVPLNDFIKIEGIILASDSKEAEIKKGHRFVLKSGSSRYQVFNEQEKALKIGEEIVVYGEYYGFIKGTLIEKGE